MPISKVEYAWSMGPDKAPKAGETQNLSFLPWPLILNILVSTTSLTETPDRLSNSARTEVLFTVLVSD